MNHYRKLLGKPSFRKAKNTSNRTEQSVCSTTWTSFRRKEMDALQWAIMEHWMI